MSTYGEQDWAFSMSAINGTHAIRRGHLRRRIDDDPASAPQATPPHSDRSDQLAAMVGSDGLAHIPGGTPGDDDNERQSSLWTANHRPDQAHPPKVGRGRLEVKSLG